MNRREFLSRGALVAGTVALGGCTEHVLEEAESKPPVFDDVYDETEVDLPVPQRFEVAEEGTLQTEGTTFEDPEEFWAYLDGQGLLVETLRRTVEDGTRILELEYADEAFVDRGLTYSLGRISGGYAALVAGEHPVDELDASIHTSGGVEFGEFEIATEWAERYLDGELTAARYAGMVYDTVNPVAGRDPSGSNATTFEARAQGFVSPIE